MMGVRGEGASLRSLRLSKRALQLTNYQSSVPLLRIIGFKSALDLKLVDRSCFDLLRTVIPLAGLSGRR